VADEMIEIEGADAITWYQASEFRQARLLFDLRFGAVLEAPVRSVHLGAGGQL
jgi:hypothetical protein